MSTVKEIESAILRLSSAEMREIHDWLENFLEDQLELKEEFRKQIETSEYEMAQEKRGDLSLRSREISQVISKTSSAPRQRR